MANLSNVESHDVPLWMDDFYDRLILYVRFFSIKIPGRLITCSSFFWVVVKFEIKFLGVNKRKVIIIGQQYRCQMKWRHTCSQWGSIQLAHLMQKQKKNARHVLNNIKWVFVFPTDRETRNNRMNYFSFCHKNVIRSKNETISLRAFNEFINQNVKKGFFSLRERCVWLEK